MIGNSMVTEKGVRIGLPSLCGAESERRQTKARLQEDLIHVAPSPVFARFKGANDRVVRGVKMLRGVLILGLIAAPDMAANQADAKVHPRVSGLETILAPLSAGRDRADLIQMSTLHLNSLSDRSARLLPAAGPAHQALHGPNARNRRPPHKCSAGTPEPQPQVILRCVRYRTEEDIPRSSPRKKLAVASPAAGCSRMAQDRRTSRKPVGRNRSRARTRKSKLHENMLPA